jgi:hypothetical protein
MQSNERLAAVGNICSEERPFKDSESIYKKVFFLDKSMRCIYFADRCSPSISEIRSNTQFSQGCQAAGLISEGS